MNKRIEFNTPYPKRYTPETYDALREDGAQWHKQGVIVSNSLQQPM